MQDMQVTMLGDFSIAVGDNSIGAAESRTQKVWLLLAYLIYYRKRTVSQAELYHLLWDDDADNPQNALRVLMHRTRVTLNRIDPSAGHFLILRKNDGYQWNPEAATWVDAEEFEQLCQKAEASDDPREKIKIYDRALGLYHSDFLENLSGESWVRVISMQFHDMYMGAVHTQLELLESEKSWEAIVALCRKALHIDSYCEEFYSRMMRSLQALNQQQEVINVYEQARQVFIGELGTIPSEEIRQAYYDATQNIETKTVSIEAFCDQLQEKGEKGGALVCDFDFFKSIFQAKKRAIARSGIPLHVALITVSGKDGGNPPSRSLDYIMECLQEQLLCNLRRGDVVTRCSIFQYAILLQLATYENCCMICERIIKSYMRKYPHSPIELGFTIQPIEETNMG